MFFVVAVAVAASIQVYLWWRLVRSTTGPGRWRRVCTAAFVVGFLSLLGSMVFGTQVGPEWGWLDRPRLPLAGRDVLPAPGAAGAGGAAAGRTATGGPRPRQGTGSGAGQGTGRGGWAAGRRRRPGARPGPRSGPPAAAAAWGGDHRRAGRRRGHRLRRVPGRFAASDQTVGGAAGAAAPAGPTGYGWRCWETSTWGRCSGPARSSGWWSASTTWAPTSSPSSATWSPPNRSGYASRILPLTGMRARYGT